jgi:hypothetical protein
MLLISATPLRRSVSRAVAVVGAKSNNLKTGCVLPPLMGSIRHLNVHEYISMEMLHNNNIPAPKSYAVTTPEQAETIYNQKCK